MAEEAGKLLELLTIDDVVETYQKIYKMPPADLVRRLEGEKVSTSGHMPELRGRLLRLEIQKCHPHVLQVPWYEEDEHEVQRKDVKENEEKDYSDYEIKIIKEQSQINSLVERLDSLEKQVDKFKIRPSTEEYNTNVVESNAESVHNEKECASKNSNNKGSRLDLDENDATVNAEPKNVTDDIPMNNETTKYFEECIEPERRRFYRKLNYGVRGQVLHQQPSVKCRNTLPPGLAPEFYESAQNGIPHQSNNMCSWTPASNSHRDRRLQARSNSYAADFQDYLNSIY